MNISLNKRPDRIFVLTCGRSCDNVDFLDFLKGEYVIAISRWAFLYKEIPFDFYYINDCHRLMAMTAKYGDLNLYKEFMASDSVKWYKNFRSDKTAFKKYNIKFGEHSYPTYPWNSASLDDTLLLNSDGSMQLDQPQEYFNDDYFKKIPLQYTGFGSATRVGIDLAYYLKFKTCYIIGADPVYLDGGWYSKHITDISVPARASDPSSTYSRTTLFSGSVWKRRYKMYKGFNVRRVVSKDIFDIERKEPTSNRKRKFFKTVFYEDLIDDSPEVIDDIEYYDWIP